MEQCIFTFPLIVGGTTEKVSQFSMPIMSVYNEILCLKEQKCIFEHGRKIKPIKYFHNCTINVFKFPLFSFSVLPSLSSCLYYIKMCCAIVKSTLFQVIFTWISVAGFLNKSNCFTSALSATKFTTFSIWFWSHFVVLLMSTA